MGSALSCNLEMLKVGDDMKQLALVLLFSACVFAHGQSALRVGMTRQEVASKYGAPLKYFDSGTQLYLKYSPPIVEGNLFEVHSRQVAGKKFELKIHYKDDLSQSRLHPTRRLDWLIVEFDRPQPSGQASALGSE